MKLHHPFQILLFALLLFLNACSETPSSLHFEGAVGTYSQQLQSGASDVQVGTVFILKLKGGEGLLLERDAFVTVTGPEGWNGGEEMSFVYPAGSFWAIAPRPETAPLAGAYTVTVTQSGVVLERSLLLTNPLERLETTPITLSREGDGLEVTWTPVAGARGYYVRLFDGVTGAQVFPDRYTLATSLAFEGVEAEGEYVAALYSTNIDTVTDNPNLPPQFNMSDSLARTSGAGVTGLSSVGVEPERSGVSVR